MFDGMVVVWILFISLFMFIVSNALLRSSDTRTVREGGFGSLNPFAIVFVIRCMAVIVEWLALNPCWWLAFGRLSFMSFSMSFSNVFDIGDR